MPLLSRETDLPTLVQRCVKQDERAWSELVDRFKSLVYSVPRRYGLGPDDAADVFQATFHALVKGLDRIENPHTLPRWLAVTASRESLRILRVSGRDLPFETDEMSLDEVLSNEDASAEENALKSVEAEELRKATEALPDRCRDLLKMLYLEGEHSYQEISDSTGIPLGAIGPTRARCLEKLRKKLEEGGFFG